jgi:NAD(P)-dependent dehydrogenase (short-subunit alcohol dehydrogenase family)
VKQDPICQQTFIEALADLCEVFRKSKFIKCDVTDWKELSAAFAQAKQIYGKIDLVFANAGVPEDNTVFEDLLDDDGVLSPPNMAVIDINLKGLITSECFHLFP